MSLKKEKTLIIITEDEMAMIDLLSENVRALHNEIHKTNVEQNKVMEAVFLRFLQQGKWNVKIDSNGYSYRISPGDYETKNLIVELLSKTFNMGYHDSFSISSDGIYIHGYVNDGELDLDVSFSGGMESDRVRNSLKTLNIDFDFGEMIREAATDKIRELDEEIARSISQRDRLIHELGEM